MKSGVEANPAVLPPKQRYAWLLGGVSDYLICLTILSLAMPIYNVGLGISAVWIGWALAIPRALDAIVDPFIGNLSDNTRTRWGRRRPYLFGGAIVCAAAFAIMWTPPSGWDKQEQYVYFFICSLVYFAGYSFFSIAYNALGLELCTDSGDRARLWSARVIATQIVGLLMPWLYKLCLLPVFGGNELMGIRYVGPATAVIILVTGLMPAIYCRERMETQAQPKVAFIAGLRTIARNRPFLLISGTNLFFQVAVFVFSPLTLYVNLYYVCRGDKAQTALLGGYYGTIVCILGVVTPPLVARIATRFGKKPVVAAALGLAALGIIAAWFLYDPRNPYLQLAATPLLAMACLIIFALMQPMVADVCDLDEAESGLRREGTFSAVGALLIKASVAATSVLVGYLLKFAGVVDGTSQSDRTILILRGEFVGLPLAMIAVASVLLYFYPVTEAQVKEARGRLDEGRNLPPGVLPMQPNASDL